MGQRKKMESHFQEGGGGNRAFKIHETWQRAQYHWRPLQGTDDLMESHLGWDFAQIGEQCSENRIVIWFDENVFNVK